VLAGLQVRDVLRQPRQVLDANALVAAARRARHLPRARARRQGGRRCASAPAARKVRTALADQVGACPAIPLARLAFHICFPHAGNRMLETT